MTAADRLAILEQIARYSYAWDARDLDAYLARFTPDALGSEGAGRDRTPPRPATRGEGAGG